MRTELESDVDLLDMIGRQSAQRGAAPALIQAGGGPDRIMSWADLFGAASAARSAARARGSQGPAALLLCGNDPRMVPLLFGLIGHRGVMPINPLLPTDACAHLLREAGATELLFDDRSPAVCERAVALEAGAANKVRLVPVSDAFSADPDATTPPTGSGLLMIHTSGSTGAPRIAAHDARRLTGVMDAWADLLYPSHPVLLSLAPLFSAAGLLGAAFFCVRQGGTLIIPGGDGPASPGFQADLPRVITAHAPTMILAIPPVLQRLSVLAPLLGGRLEALLSGGMLMSDPVGLDISARYGVPLHHVYASSELSLISSDTYFPDGRVVGRMRPEVTLVRVEDPETGESCPVGEVGEIRVASPLLPVKGPYLVPQERDLIGDLFRTGDTGLIDQTGRLVLTGRISDLVKYNGRRVPMLPVEEAAKMISGLTCVCVQGPDPETGEAITLFVEGEPPEGLVTRLRALLPDPACTPRRVIGLDRIPVVGLGKPDRSALTRVAQQRIAEEALSSAGLTGSVSIRGTFRSGFLTEIRSDDPADRVAAALRGLFGPVRVLPETSG